MCVYGMMGDNMNKAVTAELNKLRNASDEVLRRLNADSAKKRVKWFRENRESFTFISNDILDSAYRLLLARFKITQAEAPVISRTENRITFHSCNFCPTLEACRLLGLDTREICRKLNEASTDTLVKQIDPRLEFSRNYEKLRPYAEYCEEMISISPGRNNRNSQEII